MSMAATDFGNVALGSILIDPGASDDIAVAPIMTEINGADARALIAANSLQIQDTLGQPVAASFTMINGSPVIGDVVRIKFYEQVIFSGTIDHVSKQSPDLRTVNYAIDCLDWSQTLFRRKIRRNFTSSAVQNIIDSLLDNELVGEGLSIGTIDTRATMPLVSATGAKAFDVMRDIAGATGQTFYVDFDKSIQMRSTTVPVAPLVLDETNVLMAGTINKTDRETYRNVQTVNVTGTPVAQEDALKTTQQRRNNDQIAARQAIEGGTGIYEEVEDITHPTSNDAAAIALLGIGYAHLRLATSGTPRQTFSCQVRGYGFRAGQIASVNLPTFGVIGSYVIQRVTIRESAARYLFHDLELTNSSLQQRAYEAWLGIVKGGKVTVQIPSALTNNLATFVYTGGSQSWVVPAGVVLAEITCRGGSGGAGGSASYGNVCQFLVIGGKGGNSGLAVTTLDVLPGQTITLDVGVNGVKGTDGTEPSGGFCGTVTIPGDGTSGAATKATLLGAVVCQSDPGTGGIRANIVGNPHNGADGNAGGGIGDAVTVGGGMVGGSNAIPHNPKDGLSGTVEIRW